MYPFFSKLRLIQRPYTNQLNEVTQQFQLSSVQWALLKYLGENGPATFSDVALYWHVEKPSITPIAQKLNENNLIYIAPGEDKRQKFMHLTALGLQRYEEMQTEIVRFQQELMKDITNEEIEIAEAVLDKLHRNLKRRG